jgi:hypothetical protein
MKLVIEMTVAIAMTSGLLVPSVVIADEEEIGVVEVTPKNESAFSIWMREPAIGGSGEAEEFCITFPRKWEGRELRTATLYVRDDDGTARIMVPMQLVGAGPCFSSRASLSPQYARRSEMHLLYEQRGNFDLVRVDIILELRDYVKERPYRSQLDIVRKSSFAHETSFSYSLDEMMCCIDNNNWNDAIHQIDKMIKKEAGQDKQCHDALHYLRLRCEKMQGLADGVGGQRGLRTREVEKRTPRNNVEKSANGLKKPQWAGKGGRKRGHHRLLIVWFVEISDVPFSGPEALIPLPAHRRLPWPKNFS